VSHVIAVSAGKGGVGKSTVAVNLAVALAQEGARVGLLDADVYGPSVPLMMGVKGRQPTAVTGPDGQQLMIPIEAYNIKMMSIGFMVEDEKPVIWRGPMVSQLLRQFLYNVDWAPLDYLIIDMPPGTGDIALTLAQSLQNVGLTGAVTVTTPQSVATLDVLKSMEMFKKVNVALLGIVENMAYFIAPDTGARYDIFGSGGAERLAEQEGVPLLGRIPLGMSVREGGDSGQPAVISDSPDAYAETFRDIARQLAARVSVMEYA
jgi:ATP-binding protein involved in chromosome partitioning